MQTQATYPTIEHEQASETIVDFFSIRPDVEAVLLTGSCARGKASRDSCLDIAVLLRPEVLSTQKTTIEQQWSDFYET